MRLVLACLVLIAARATAQTEPDSLELTGRVVDSVTREPIPRIWVCAFSQGAAADRELGFCAPADTAESFRLPAVPRSWRRLQVFCSTEG